MQLDGRILATQTQTMAKAAHNTDDITTVPSQRHAKASPAAAVRQPFHGYVSVQRRGLVALPTALRERYHLDDPGAQVEITEREDGVLELRPTVAVPANEAWFWDERWQAGEREVDANYAAGNFTTYENVEDFMAHLERLESE